MLQRKEPWTDSVVFLSRAVAKERKRKITADKETEQERDTARRTKETEEVLLDDDSNDREILMTMTNLMTLSMIMMDNDRTDSHLNNILDPIYNDERIVVPQIVGQVVALADII
jgi:hypothetical protein